MYRNKGLAILMLAANGLLFIGFLIGILTDNANVSWVTFIAVYGHPVLLIGVYVVTNTKDYVLSEFILVRNLRIVTPAWVIWTIFANVYSYIENIHAFEIAAGLTLLSSICWTVSMVYFWEMLNFPRAKADATRITVYEIPGQSLWMLKTLGQQYVSETGKLVLNRNRAVTRTSEVELARLALYFGYHPVHPPKIITSY